jgi:hypothetical protein
MARSKCAAVRAGNPRSSSAPASRSKASSRVSRSDRTTARNSSTPPVVAGDAGALGMSTTGKATPSTTCCCGRRAFWKSRRRGAGWGSRRDLGRRWGRLGFGGAGGGGQGAAAMGIGMRGGGGSAGRRWEGRWWGQDECWCGNYQCTLE